VHKAIHTMPRIGGLLLAVVLGTAWATADEYSGLRDPNTAAPATAPMGQPISGSVVPSTPSRPAPSYRPDTWPGAAPAPAYPDTGYPPASVASANYHSAQAPQNPSLPPTARIIQTTPCEDARILARVGSEVVLAAEAMAYVVREIFDSTSGIHGTKPSELSRAAWALLNAPAGQVSEQQRKSLLRAGANVAVETKLLYLDARRSIPDENFTNVEKQSDKIFEESELPELLKAARVRSRRELDDELRRLGSSLDWQKRIFMERSLARQWMRGSVKFDEPITHDAMLAYYDAHLADYEHPARARWEQISVRVSKYPGKAEAYAALARLGDQVQEGAPFAEIARQGSDGVTAAQGGVRDWTTRGSLVSKALDEAVFSLPVGALSPIIEDEQGLHIVRVIERKEAYRAPFIEAQAEITEHLRGERVQKKLNEYVSRLKKDTPIWTVYDKPAQDDADSSSSVARRKGPTDR
jgi:hypothetical protein